MRFKEKLPLTLVPFQLFVATVSLPSVATRCRKPRRPNSAHKVGTALGRIVTGCFLSVLLFAGSATWAFDLVMGAGSSEGEAEEVTSTDEAEAPRFSFRLKDGSSLTGKLQEDSIKIKSAFGSLTVPVKDIVSYGEGEFGLKDGSVVKGQIVTPALTLVSKYGKLSLEPKEIAWFNFRSVPQKAEAKGRGEEAD